MREVLDRVGLWPAWVKVGAATLGVLMVAGGAGGALAWRTGFAGRSNPGNAVQTSARPRPTPSQSPVVGTPTPVASTLSCRLPISNGQPGSGGFVVFPSAKFQADPASSVKSDAVYGMSFDLAAGKWLPVPRSYISPDGTRYAYWDWQSRSIVAVSVASGAETQIGPRLNGAASAARLNAQNWQLIEALDDGVYATPAGETQTGLWLFPWSGSGERQVTGTGFWHAIGGSSAWGTVSQSVPEGAATVIMRMDLGGGGPSEWFSRPGLHSRVAGFDRAGHPVVEASSKDVTEVWLVNSQTEAVKLLTIPPPPPNQQRSPYGARPGLQSVVGDDKGLWLATSEGLYLSTSSGTEKVGSVTGQLGGGCH